MLFDVLYMNILNSCLMARDTVSETNYNYGLTTYKNIRKNIYFQRCVIF